MKKQLLIFDNANSRAYFWGYTCYILNEHGIYFRGLANTREIVINDNVYIKFILIQDMASESSGMRYENEVFISKGIKQDDFDGILKELLEVKDE